MVPRAGDDEQTTAFAAVLALKDPTLLDRVVARLDAGPRRTVGRLVDDALRREPPATAAERRAYDDFQVTGELCTGLLMKPVPD